jgi:hypothetical protein
MLLRTQLLMNILLQLALQDFQAGIAKHGRFSAFKFATANALHNKVPINPIFRLGSDFGQCSVLRVYSPCLTINLLYGTADAMGVLERGNVIH